MKLMPDLRTPRHRPVLRADHAGPVLRRARADSPASPTPRPALDRQEGRGLLPEVDRHRRHRLFGPKPSSSCSTTCASRPPRTTPATSEDRLVELPTNTTPNMRRQHRPPPAPKGGYFPVAPVDSAQDMRGEMLAVMAEMGVPVEKHHHEVAPAQHELGLKFDTLVTMADRMQIYKYVVHRSPTPTARPRPSCPSRSRRQRLGHAHPPVDLEGRQAAVRRQQVRRACRDLPLLHRRHHQARQGDQRLHQPDHQQLQAPGAGLRGAGAAGLFGAQPLGLVPHPVRRRPEGQARRGPLPRSAGQPLPRLRGDADGRPRRHQEQDPSGRSDGQEPLRPAAGRAEEDPDRLRLAARGAARTSTRTAAS
jgi:hypothetical protein